MKPITKVLFVFLSIFCQSQELIKSVAYGVGAELNITYPDPFKPLETILPDGNARVPELGIGFSFRTNLEFSKNIGLQSGVELTQRVYRIQMRELFFPDTEIDPLDLEFHVNSFGIPLFMRFRQDNRQSWTVGVIVSSVRSTIQKIASNWAPTYNGTGELVYITTMFPVKTERQLIPELYLGYTFRLIDQVSNAHDFGIGFRYGIVPINELNFEIKFQDEASTLSYPFQVSPNVGTVSLSYTVYPTWARFGSFSD